MVMMPPAPPVSAPPKMSTKVTLSISCQKLKDLDILSKSDPVCKLYNWNERTNAWVSFGQTECINNNLNPQFKTTFQVEYHFEKSQRLKFEVLDQDVSSFELIGYLETTLGVIMGSRNQTYTTDLKHDKSKGKRGSISIQGEAVKESNFVVNYKISATDLGNI